MNSKKAKVILINGCYRVFNALKRGMKTFSQLPLRQKIVSLGIFAVFVIVVTVTVLLNATLPAEKTAIAFTKLPDLPVKVMQSEEHATTISIDSKNTVHPTDFIAKQTQSLQTLQQSLADQSRNLAKLITGVSDLQDYFREWQTRINEWYKKQALQQNTQALVEQQLNDTLQQWRKTIDNQLQSTHSPKAIPPKTIERFFTLAAVQGFSDGLRAIIDIDGHQTALAIGDSCAACHGWRLKKLDFASQSAIFVNQNREARLRVA